MGQEKRFCAYLRVSTQRQGVSGLGLEAQQEIIKTFLHGEPMAEFVEVESGRHNDRPKLKEALAFCRKEGCTLIVAKLDRLSRSVSFLSQLLESDVDLVFCDFPQANKMMLHIVSAIAQYEAELISSRTRQALAAKKARGAKLGNPEHLMNKHEQALKNSNATNREKSMNNPNVKRSVAFIRTLVQQGKSQTEIARILNEEGFITAQGCKFSPAIVHRLIKRYKLS